MFNLRRQWAGSGNTYFGAVCLAGGGMRGTFGCWFEPETSSTPSTGPTPAKLSMLWLCPPVFRRISSTVVPSRGRWNIGCFLKRFYLVFLTSSWFPRKKKITIKIQDKGLSLSNFLWYLVIVKIINIKHLKGHITISQKNHDSKIIFMQK